MRDAEKIRIVVKKRPGGHGHGPHGGAWKVAYADFVTAMMAFFMVMWLINQNEPVKRAIGGYFRDPLGTLDVAGSDAQQGAKGVLDAGSSPMPGQAALLEMPVQGPGRGAEREALAGGDADEDGGPRRHPQDEAREALERTAEEIRRRLASLEGFAEIAHLVELQQTPEGLRIELMESDRGAFFELGSRRLTEIGERVVRAIAPALGASGRDVVIEGHTDSLAYAPGGYSNWDLSTDRANAARRLLEDSGIGASQVREIRGHAAERLRLPEHPEDPRNRRVSILVLAAPPEASPPSGATASVPPPPTS